MDRSVFERLLEAHGAEPDRWPRAAREEALRLCARDPEARRLWEEFRALENVLDHAAPDPRQEEALMDTILGQAGISSPGDDEAEGHAKHRDARKSASAPLVFPQRRSALAKGKKARTAITRRQRAAREAANDNAPLYRLRWIAATVMLAALVTGIYVGAQLSATPIATTVLAGLTAREDIPDDPVLLAALDDEDLAGLMQ